MRVLIIKLSSMGDILHTLPAITECLSNFPQIKIDWIVESGFEEILKWHPGIQHVYTFPLRAARKTPKLFLTDMPRALRAVRSQYYDLVIDAQGLIKSALLAKIIKTKRIVGLDKNSCREPFASKLYHQGYNIPWSAHAVVRLKQLFSSIFGYPLCLDIDYGLSKSKFINPLKVPEIEQNKFMIFLHGTTWQTKHWPEKYWQELILLIKAKNPGIKILLPWGSELELARAQSLAKMSPQAQVLPKLSITELAYYLSKAQAVVAVDTGLGHLAAALGTKTINLYGPTDPNRTGTIGLNQIHLAVSQLGNKAYPCVPCLKRQCIFIKEDEHMTPPCYQMINPEMVIKNLAL
jgi:heptosyltransferase-1